MKKIVVAIDGLSSCGKSTMAKALAQYAGYVYVDTGAMYRAVALYGMRNGWITDAEINLHALETHLDEINIHFQTNADGRQETYLNNENVENDIRSLEVGNNASRVSALGFVRRDLVRRQQRMGQAKGVVMDGRDIGTVVFPDAELKIFVTGTAEVRAQRRYDELTAKGEKVNYADVLANVRERDERDSNRTESPLRKAADAVEIDNTHLTPEQQNELVRTLFHEKTL